MVVAFSEGVGGVVADEYSNWPWSGGALRGAKAASSGGVRGSRGRNMSTGDQFWLSDETLEGGGMLLSSIMVKS